MTGINNGIILPLGYLPSIDHYCYISQKVNILFEIFETYPKQTCRNRTVVLSANGPLRLTIPVIKPYGNNTKTSEILIDHKTPWNKIHWKAICSAYNKSPFFLYYKDEFQDIYENPGDSLVNFNFNLIQQINKFLKISPQIELSTNFCKLYDSIDDKRNCNKDFCITDHELPYYNQVFNDRVKFVPNMSIVDLLFTQGPEAIFYLKSATMLVD